MLAATDILCKDKNIQILQNILFCVPHQKEVIQYWNVRI